MERRHHFNEIAIDVGLQTLRTCRPSSVRAESFSAIKGASERTPITEPAAKAGESHRAEIATAKTTLMIGRTARGVGIRTTILRN
jgi:hypothetical protein